MPTHLWKNHSGWALFVVNENVSFTACLYSLPDALCQLFGVQRFDETAIHAAHEAGVVDDPGRTLYLAHQHEDSEKQADQDGCEKDGEKLDDMLKFHKW